MKKIIYMIKRICEMNFAAMFKTAKRVSKANKASFFVVLFDIIHCGLKYMAGYVDYEVFGFYNLTTEQRETIITRGINNRFVSTLNDKELANTLDNKLLFNEKFNDFLKRDWVNLEVASLDQFADFLKGKINIIAKPVDQACGRNVEKINVETISNIEDLYNSLIEKKQFLVEDCIVQHPKMSDIYPNAVNTLRIVTVTKNNKVNIMFRSIRMGNDGNVVDNFNHGGLFTTIDEYGIVRKPAVDKKGNIYSNHPYTNTELVNFQIPLFNEAIEYVKAMAISIPEVGYVGWDIAITEKGPVVVEANPFPGHDIYQSKVHMNEDGTGLRKVFERIIFED